MAVSNYFNNFEASNEQGLLDDLVAEAIKIYGHNVYYLPRVLDNEDPIYGESDIASFNSAHMVEMYIVSVDGFQGDGHFMSMHGLQIRDQVTFSVSRRTFAEEVIDYENALTLTRPREGDLIFFPLNNACFQIKYVDNWDMFYQLGKLQTWKMTCEKFEYSSEHFNTGISEIDALERNTSMDMLQYALLDENGDYLVDTQNNIITNVGFDVDRIDPLSDNDDIQAESNTFIDFSILDPFSEGKI